LTCLDQSKKREHIFYTYTFQISEQNANKEDHKVDFSLPLIDIFFLTFICYYHVRLMHVCTCYVCLSNFTIWSIACIFFFFLSNRKRTRDKLSVDGDSIMCRYFWEIRGGKRIESCSVFSLVRQNKPIEIRRRTTDENYNNSNSNRSTM